MDSVSGRLTILITQGAIVMALGTIGPEALRKWTAILRSLGTIEAIDAAGEVTHEEAA